MGVFKCASDDSDESSSSNERPTQRFHRSTPFVVRRANRPGFGPIDRPRATSMKLPAQVELSEKKLSPAHDVTQPKRGFAVPEYDSDLSDESETNEGRLWTSLATCDPFRSTPRLNRKPVTDTSLLASMQRRSPRDVAVSRSPASKDAFLGPLEKLKVALSTPKREKCRRPPGSDKALSENQLRDSTPEKRSPLRSPCDPGSDSAKRNAAAVKATVALRVTTHGPHPAKVEAQKRQYQKAIEDKFLELQRITEEADKHASDHVKQLRERERKLDDEVVRGLQVLQLEGERQIAQQINKIEAKDQAMKMRHADAMVRCREDEARKSREEAQRLAEEQAEKEAKESSELEAQAQQLRQIAERAESEERAAQQIAERAESEERAAQEDAQQRRAQQAENELVSLGAREEAEPYVQLMRHLKQEVIPKEKWDPSIWEFCTQKRRDLTKRLCQVTDKQESINLASCEVDRVLKEGRDKSALAYEFLMYQAAKTAIGCAERNGMKDIPPIARVCVNVMKVHKDFPKYFMARLIKKCPYAVPRYAGQEDNSEQTRKAKGYKEGETFDVFLSRMRSMLQLYATLMTLEPLATPSKSVGGMEHAWRWLARHCNLRPREYFAGSLVDAFLSVAATPLLNRYGTQFLKVLAFLRTEYVGELLRLHEVRNARPYADFILTNVQRFEEQGVYPAENP